MCPNNIIDLSCVAFLGFKDTRGPKISSLWSPNEKCFQKEHIEINALNIVHSSIQLSKFHGPDKNRSD